MSLSRDLQHAALAAGILFTLPLSGCSSDPEPEPEQPAAFSLSFVAVANGKEVGCTDAIGGLGPGGKITVELSDLRFYVSNLKLLDADGQPVSFTLDDNEFQYNGKDGSVSLIDLTGTTEGACAASSIAFAEGTKRVNAAMKGTTLVSQVASVSFDVGVPQQVMKETIAAHTPEGAPSPLGEMYWTWATGYRHFVFNFAVDAGADGKGDGYVHIGSRDCGPADGHALEDRANCTYVNTPTVALGAFDLKKNVVQVDLPAILKDLDFVAPIYDPMTFMVIGQGPGVECHSSPMQPDCPLIFPRLGLDLTTGKAEAAADAIFSVR
jgi:uncharacterized repeat protein (TIGR04052 family)